MLKAALPAKALSLNVPSKVTSLFSAETIIIFHLYFKEKDGGRQRNNSLWEDLQGCLIFTSTGFLRAYSLNFIIVAEASP
jgi:hypothetical protein